MSVVEIEIERPLDQVWASLLDAESYPRWLIGAQRVEAPVGWPTPGTTFAHRIGLGLLRLAGSTTSHEVLAPRSLHLRAGMGPLGEFDVRFELVELGPDRTRVAMREQASGGVVLAVDRIGHRLVELTIDRRNAGSLRRLRDHLVGAALQP